jgi:hypothetical protein
MRSMQTLAAAAARSTSAAIPVGARGLATKAEHFPGIDKIKYEGEKSMNPLAFKHYRPDEKVLGKVCDAHASGAAALNSGFEAGAAVTAGARRSAVPSVLNSGWARPLHAYSPHASHADYEGLVPLLRVVS